MVIGLIINYYNLSIIKKWAAKKFCKLHKNFFSIYRVLMLWNQQITLIQMGFLEKAQVLIRSLRKDTAGRHVGNESTGLEGVMCNSAAVQHLTDLTFLLGSSLWLGYLPERKLASVKLNLICCEHIFSVGKMEIKFHRCTASCKNKLFWREFRQRFMCLLEWTRVLMFW